MKRIIAAIMMCGLIVVTGTGCNTKVSRESSAPENQESLTQEDIAAGEENQKEGESKEASGETGGMEIRVVSREDGSGTRGAFVELFGIEEKDTEGNKIDRTIDQAEITNNTAVMMGTVAGDDRAIGYISLGSLSDTVKAVSIDSVYPSVEAVKDGTYPISRPFLIAPSGNTNEAADDFISYIMSSEGQAVIEEKGYISVQEGEPYSGARAEGKVVVAGSSSVTPVMEALKEAYQAVNPGAEIEIQQSDSTTGIRSVTEGICDIGMASRALKESELEQGLKPVTIAMDGIAVIVSNSNQTENLTKDQVKEIYTGSVLLWSDLN